MKKNEQGEDKNNYKEHFSQSIHEHAGYSLCYLHYTASVNQTSCGQQASPHLAAAGGQAFSKGLDGADLVVLDQLGETLVGLTVSRYYELPVRVLGDDKMAAPVVAPLEEKKVEGTG